MEAFRAAVVSDPDAPWAFIEVLAVDGSEESVDALLPIFHRAKREADEPLLRRLSQLRELCRPNSSMNELLRAAEKASTASE